MSDSRIAHSRRLAEAYIAGFDDGRIRRGTLSEPQCWGDHLVSYDLTTPERKVGLAPITIRVDFERKKVWSNYMDGAMPFEDE